MEGAALGAASMGPGTHSKAVIFDPNGPGMGLDLDFNIFDVGNTNSDAINFDHDVANFSYNNIDRDFDFNDYNLGELDINIGMQYSTNTAATANFDFGDALQATKEAESVALLSSTNTAATADFDFGDALQATKEAESVALPQLPIGNEKCEELTLAEVYNPGTSMLQEPVPSHSSTEMRAQKRKKTDEVDKGDILPEGSRRNRNKTARARGLDSLV